MTTSHSVVLVHGSFKHVNKRFCGRPPAENLLLARAIVRLERTDNGVALSNRSGRIFAVDQMSRVLQQLHHLWIFVGVAARGGEPDCGCDDQRENLRS